MKVIAPPELLLAIKNRESSLLAHWHGDELVLQTLIGPYRVATMSSTSADGEIMNTIIHLLGGWTSRGSSTRGAVSGLLGLVRLVKRIKCNCSFSVDGPKGPLHVVKPGVFEMSRLLNNASIYPAGAACDRAWRFEKSWNKMYLPKPFAKVCIVWAGPLPLPEEIDPRSIELQNQLAQEIAKAHEYAERELKTM